MLFSTSSSPAFSWHLQTDTLLFCTSALAMLGMREDTAPATMEALLEHVPPSQRRFLRQQRAVLRSGGRLPGAACAYVCNGRDVNEHMHVLRRDDDDRPQIILACLELLDPPASLPEDVEDGYWSYTRGQAMPFLDMRCMLLLGLGEAPGTLDREGLRRLHGRYRVAGLLSRLRRWLDARDGAERLRLVLMPRRPQGTPLLFTASVLVRDDRGRARAAAGTLAPLLEHKAASVGGIRRLLLAMTGCRDGLWDWDVWSGQVYYSQSYLAMLGHTAETFPAELGSWIRAIHPDDHEKAVALPMKVAASPDAGDAFVCTYRMRHADGSWLWILGRGCVAGRDSEGRALRVVGMHTDVRYLDLTRDFSSGPLHPCGTVAVVAAPVYGGRVAETAVARISRLKGEGTAAVAIVLYGNRDSLLPRIRGMLVTVGKLMVRYGRIQRDHRGIDWKVLDVRCHPVAEKCVLLGTCLQIGLLEGPLVGTDMGLELPVIVVFECQHGTLRGHFHRASAALMRSIVWRAA